MSLSWRGRGTASFRAEPELRSCPRVIKHQLRRLRPFYTASFVYPDLVILFPTSVVIPQLLSSRVAPFLFPTAIFCTTL